MTPRELFDEWLDGRLVKISETSHNLPADYERLIPRIREVAEFLGLEWDPVLVPQYVHESIEASRDPD